MVAVHAFTAVAGPHNCHVTMKKINFLLLFLAVDQLRYIEKAYMEEKAMESN
jgi:hypothetical protein